MKTDQTLESFLDRLQVGPLDVVTLIDAIYYLTDDQINAIIRTGARLVVIFTTCQLENGRYSLPF